MAVIDGGVLAMLGKDWGYNGLLQTYQYVMVYDVALSTRGHIGVSLSTACGGRPHDSCQRYVSFHRFAEDVEPMRRLWSGTSPPVSIATIAGGPSVAIACTDGAIYLADATRPNAPYVLFARHTTDLQSVQGSPDGTKLLSAGFDRMCCWDIASRRLLWDGPGIALHASTFDPQSGCIVVLQAEGSVCELDPATGREIKLVVRLEHGAGTIAVSPDGRHMAIAGIEGRLRVWDRSAESWLWSCSHRWSQLSFSPDGTLLCSCLVGEAGSLALRDSSTGQVVTTLFGHTRLVLGTTFSSEGTLYSWGSDGTIRLWKKHRSTPIKVEAVVPSFLW